MTQEGCCGARPNGGCCKDVTGSAESNGHTNGINGQNGEYKVNRGISTSLTPTDFEPYDSTQEPICPPALQLNDDYDKQFVVIQGQGVTWYRPTSLSQLLDLKSRFPHAKLVVGNTEVALEMKFKHCDYPVLIHPVMVQELQTVVKEDKHIVLGGCVNLSFIEAVLKEEIASRSEEETRVFAAICQMLQTDPELRIRRRKHYDRKPDFRLESAFHGRWMSFDASEERSSATSCHGWTVLHRIPSKHRLT